MSDVEQRVIAILKDLRPEGAFEDSRNYLRDGLLDSTDIVSLVAELDATYGISIDGTDILPEHFTNANTVAALLTKYGVGT